MYYKTMKKYIIPEAKYIRLEEEQLIALSTNDEVKDSEDFSNRRHVTIWDSQPES